MWRSTRRLRRARMLSTNAPAVCSGMKTSNRQFNLEESDIHKLYCRARKCTICRSCGQLEFL